MQEFASTEAKDKWGLITDTALREPVAITRHGRPSLVVTSIQDYQELQRMKLGHLQAEVQLGLEDLNKGRYSSKTAEEIIAASRARLRKRKHHARSANSASR